MNFLDDLRSAAAHVAQQRARSWPALMTYYELERRTNRVANGLHVLGIGPGDHVAVLVNDHRFVETLLGALRAGATVTPTTTRAHYSTLAASWMILHARVLFASADFAAEAARLAAAGLRHVFVMDADAPGATRYDDWLAAQPAERRVTEKAADDLAYISYTSGSTGRPKGVLLTHGAVEWATRNLRRASLRPRRSLSPRCRCSTPTACSADSSRCSNAAARSSSCTTSTPPR